MNSKDAEKLRVGQRVRWEPLEPTETQESGEVTRNTGKHISIKWDDEDFDRTYPIDGKQQGLAHVEVVK